MIVDVLNFDDVLARLDGKTHLALDTETTGLRPYHGDRLFSLILCDGEETYYFNWGRSYPTLDLETFQLGDSHLAALATFFAKPRTIIGHNLKFDLAMLRAAGIEVAGDLHCTMTTARVLDSTLFPGQFSLDHLAGLIGHKKDDAAKEWIIKNKAYTVEKSEGKKTQRKNLHYALVPWDIITKYGERDAAITWELAAYQRCELEKLADITPDRQACITPVYENECKLLRTVFEMEALGVQVDQGYCRRAADFALGAQVDSAAQFERLTGERYLESALLFKKVFAEEKWRMGAVTATGKQNPSFDSDVLAGFAHPAAKEVLRHRKAKSDANYYQGFLYEADANGVVHASFNQHATATGRFSSSNPNLQNLTKDEDGKLAEEFVVRRAIVPRPGMVFHMLDYDQVEYRLMLEYAARLAQDQDGVLALVRKILGGLDVHQATADVAGTSRRTAKTVNFLTLYGGGVANLASQLATTESAARAIRDSIFRAAPEIALFIRGASDTAKARRFIINWFGRRCRFPDPDFCYRAANYLIQGGCADVMKVAMNRIRDYLIPFKTRLVLTVHDEVVLEGPLAEAAVVVRGVKCIMETVYLSRFLPLTCGVDHSFLSLADKTKGIAQ